MSSKIFETFVRPLRRFAADRFGNFSIVTALILLPLTAAVGASVDLSHALSLRSLMREAADAAILDAVSNSALKDIYQGAAITPELLNRLEQRAALNFQQMANADVLRHSPATSSVNMTVNGTSIFANITYSMTMPTTFTRLLGVSELPISGSAQAKANLPRYTDVHILIDNSPSMTLAANEAERLKLVSVTARFARTNNRPGDMAGCSFACHDLNPNPNTAMNYYDLARTSGIKLRIDTVKDALTQMLDATDVEPGWSNQLRFSLYDFGDSMETIRTDATVLRMRTETDIDKVKLAVAEEEPMTTPYAEFNSKAGSSLETAMEEMLLHIPRAGNGATEGSRQQVLIFFTDGISNSLRVSTCAGQRWMPLGQCTGPFQPAICEQLKRRGTRIAIVHTEYLPIPDSPYFARRIAPFLHQVAPSLKACASPGLYRTVAFGESVDDALKSLFRQSLHQVQLTR